MKKAIIAFLVLFAVSAFTAAVSLAFCGGRLISSAVDYAAEKFYEYRGVENAGAITCSDTILITEE